MGPQTGPAIRAESRNRSPQISLPDTGRLVVITGPSGVGKSTIVRRAVERTGAAFSVSATTRPPRPGEADGREYRFVDRATFDAMVADGELLEWAEVFGECYGTPADAAREALTEGRTVILEIDVQGGLQVHERAPGATFVLILPPNDEELRRRLTGRGTEPPEALERRVSKAKDEIAAALESGVYTNTVTNDDLEAAVARVVEILQAESTRE